MRNYLKLIRVKHWLKNILVFLPIFFSINLMNTSLFSKCLIALVIFSFVSSIVYIINDINDIEKDKLHPTKKNRPLASGSISKTQAIIVIVILVILTGIMITYMYLNTKNVFTILIPIVYIVINILYSKWLKNIPIIDVVILVSGFVLRVMYGGVIVNITVSSIYT